MDAKFSASPPAKRYQALERRRRKLDASSIRLTPEIKQRLASEIAVFELNRTPSPMTDTECSRIRKGIEDAVLSLWESRPNESESQLQHLAGKIIGEAPAFRASPATPLSPNHQPVVTQRIPVALGRLFSWIESPAFREMHPVEQLTVSQLRLLEIAPFQGPSQAAIQLFSYQFLVDSDYLVPIYADGDLETLPSAIDSGFQFATQPFLDLTVRACLRAYSMVGAD